MESRPDRIMVSPAFEVTKAVLAGTGQEYKKRFFVHIIWKRIENFILSAYDAYSGMIGRSCMHDCGPHASCRCRLCVAIGDEDTCISPECKECRPTMFKWIIFWSLVAFLLLSQMIYALLIFFKAMNKRGGKNSSSFALAKCCVFDPSMYTEFDRRTYRRRHHLLFKYWPLLKLPPMLLIIVTIIMGAVLHELMSYVFSDAIRDIWHVIPEELYPSDHLMLAVQLSQTKEIYT